MNDMQKYARSLSTNALQNILEALNDEADGMEYDGLPVDDIENEIRVLEEEMESR